MIRQKLKLPFPIFIDELLKYSKKFVKDDVLFAEQLLLNACVSYLLEEAPPNEQNMYMVIELLYAGIDSDTSEESDLDRLFEGLVERCKKDALLIADLEKQSF